MNTFVNVCKRVVRADRLAEEAFNQRASDEWLSITHRHLALACIDWRRLAREVAPALLELEYESCPAQLSEICLALRGAP